MLSQLPPPRKGVLWSVLFALSFLCLSPSLASAALPAPAAYRVFSSSNGAFVLAVETADKYGRTCKLTLQRVDTTTSNKTLWTLAEALCPGRVLVDNGGQRVVLLDRFQGGVHNAGMTLLNAKGETQWQIAVANLLTSEELDEHAKVKGFFSWAQYARATLDHERVYVAMQWGRAFTVSLAEGKVE